MARATESLTRELEWAGGGDTQRCGELARALLTADRGEEGAVRERGSNYAVRLCVVLDGQPRTAWRTFRECRDVRESLTAVGLHDPAPFPPRRVGFFVGTMRGKRALARKRAPVLAAYFAACAADPAIAALPVFRALFGL